MRPSSLVVKGFDGSKRMVIGEIKLPIQIGMHVFQITSQVIDINLAYRCLLGRPWIHYVGALTSTLHQKLKFALNNKLVSCEENILISHLSLFRYIEADEDASETSFFKLLK